MDQKRIIDEFKELVSIEVHSRDERAIADVLKEKLTALGLTVTEDKAGEVLGGNTGNVYARNGKHRWQKSPVCSYLSLQAPG